mgnify:CR=1 FL=1
MAENERTPDCENGAALKEAVCIDAMRIYDSCSDKDCLEDLRVLFPASVQPVVDASANVRVRDVDVISVYIDMQPIPFNRGYYSIDLTFFFDVSLELYGGATVGCERVSGISIFNKKVILYGSEGNVKMFTSESCRDEADLQGNKVLPKATVQVAQPVALSAKLCERCRCGCERCRCGCEPCCVIPDCIASRYGGAFETVEQKNTVYVTIGLFTIVQIVRNVQMLIPAFDFCIPDKECVTSGDNPCELFRKIDFPTDEFFPPKASDCGCGCGRQNQNRI